MVKICPVSERYVNENVSRLNALFTLILAILFLFSGSSWFLLTMIADFSFRLFYEGKLSPVIMLNSYLAENLRIRKIMINAGPKIFAARIGLFLALIGFVFSLFNLHAAANLTAGILGIFCFLEASFGFCIACKIYPFAMLLNEPGRK